MLGDISGFEAQQELSRLIAQQLYDALPEGVDEIRHVVSIIAPYWQSSTLLYRGEEEVGSLPGMSGVNVNVESLRKVMYTPQGGTWFSAVFQVFGDGRMKSSFNYDDEPVFTGFDYKPKEVMPALFAQDFEAFPRPAEATPAWLAAKVEAGRVQDAQLKAEAAAEGAEGSGLEGGVPEPVAPSVRRAREGLSPRQRSLAGEVLDGVDMATPEAADEFRYVVRMLVGREQHEAVAFCEGKVLGPVVTTEDVVDKVRALRQECFTVQGGTWFSALFALSSRMGELEMSFNYDDEPVFTGPDGEPQEVSPVLYARDFEVFPRPAEATPAWLAAKVAQGRAQIAAQEQA